MGGNIFANTSPIKKENIKPTLREFFKDLKRLFPNVNLTGIETLGSVGKKPISGDIDLALPGNSIKNLSDWDLDESEVQEKFIKFKKRSRTASEEMLMKRAVIVLIAEKIEEDGNIGVNMKGSSGGTLFLTYPQFNPEGEETGENVQIDINVGDVDWLRFAYHSDKLKDDIVKGLHRTQLMLALFSAKGYTFSHNYGVKSKATNQIVATTPSKAIELLNKKYGIELTPEILKNYYKLSDYLKANLPEEQLHAIYDIYIKILDSTRAHIPPDLEQYWINNQDRLKLKGKFLPDNSPLKQYAV